MHLKAQAIKIWAYVSIALVCVSILFLFGYIFYKGSSVISWSFITQMPRGAVLGQEGGIWPAIMGSLYFTGTAVILGGIPAVATAVYLVFFCKTKQVYATMHFILKSIAGLPSIVLGLFAYSLLVKTLGLGRSILAGGVALAIMILPFIEARAEKALNEVPREFIYASEALGCSRFYTFRKIILPACWHELVAGMVLGACFAMGATAPIIFTGGVAFAAAPTSVFEPAMALPLHLYLLLAQGTSMPQVYGTAFVLMVIVLVANMLVTIFVRGRHSKKWKAY